MYGLWGVCGPWQCGRADVERVVEVVVPHRLGLFEPGLCRFRCVWTAAGSLSPVECRAESFSRGAFAASEGGGLGESLPASWWVFSVYFTGVGWAAMRTPCVQLMTHYWASALRMWTAGRWGGVSRVSHDGMARTILEGWRCVVALRRRRRSMWKD